MKLDKISISTITENEDKEVFFSLLKDAIAEIPANASPYLYHPSIVGEYWEMDAYGEDIGYRYEINLIPITNGEETTSEWNLFMEWISTYSGGGIRFHELDFWGYNGINFKSIKSLKDLQNAYPWNKK